MVEFIEGDVNDPEHGPAIIATYGTEWNQSRLHTVAGLEFNIDYEYLRNLVRQGSMTTLLGYEDDKLIAFYMGLQSTHAYDRNSTWVTEYLWYISPEYRKRPKFFKKFVEALDDHMRSRGVDVYTLAIPFNNANKHKSHKPLERAGFETLETIHIRRL